MFAVSGDVIQSRTNNRVRLNAAGSASLRRIGGNGQVGLRMRVYFI